MYSEVKARIRPDLRCMSIPVSIWKMATQLAEEDSTSVSAMIRQLIKKTYIKWLKEKQKAEKDKKSLKEGI